MTHTPSWGPAVWKEVRALLPAWFAVVAAVAGSVIVSDTSIRGLALVAYVLGATTLGALSIGHEYGYGTLSALLAQPRSRRDLLLTKLLVLTALLLLFALASWVALFDASGHLRGLDRSLTAWQQAVFVLPVLCGLLVAPWLTMVCRSTIAGAVFTMVLPGVWWTAGSLVASWTGLNTAGIDALFGGTLLMCVLGASLGWRKFMRLEAVDARGQDLQLPDWLTTRAADHDAESGAARHPMWLLAKKELRLHQMAIAAAGLYVIGWATVLVLASREPFFVLSFFYSGLVSLLVGSEAAAEERQLGTADWHALLPIATWKQWAVKVGVAAALTWVLAVGLPALVTRITAPPTADLQLTLAAATAGTLGLMVVSVYVSSLCRSGLWALLISLPVTFGVGTVAVLLAAPPNRALRGLMTAWSRVLDSLGITGFSQARLDSLRFVDHWLPGLAILGLVLMALRFGLRNQRSAERGARRAWRQGASMAAYVVVAMIVLAGWSSLEAARSRNRYTPAQRQALSESAVRHARWQHELEELTRGFDGRVGVCAGDGLAEACVNGQQRFPMQSVWKLPLAIGILDASDRGVLELDERVLVTRKDLSVYVQPIANVVGPMGFETSIYDLLRRALVDSDNAAADILLARLGGPAALEIALARHAVLNIRVDRDEKHLQSDINGLEWRPEYVDPATYDRAVGAVPEVTRDEAFQAYLKDDRDTATPRAMVELLERIAGTDPPLGLRPSSTQELRNLLKATKTFPDRLKAGVPEGWTIGHKTGTSGDWRGVTAATNDVGTIIGKVGDHAAAISIAVFIAESRAPEKDRAALMANITRALIKTY